MRTCGLVECGIVGFVGLVDFVDFWDLFTCGLVGLVDMWTCGHVGIVDLWTCELVICGLGRTASSFTTEGTTISMQDRTVATSDGLRVPSTQRAQLYLVDLWTCGLVGLVGFVGLVDVWTCGMRTCGLLDLWDLRTCGLVGLLDMWTCGYVGLVDV